MGMSISDESKVRKVLEAAIQEKGLEKLGECDIGWIPNDLHGLMVEACMTVIRTMKEMDDYHCQEKTNFGD